MFVTALAFLYRSVEIKVGMISFVSLPLNLFLPFGYFFVPLHPSHLTLIFIPPHGTFSNSRCHVYRYVKTVLPWEWRVKNKTRSCWHISCLLLYMWISTNSPGISLIRAPQKCTCITYSNVPKTPRVVCLVHWQNLWDLTDLYSGFPRFESR